MGKVRLAEEHELDAPSSGLLLQLCSEAVGEEELERRGWSEEPNVVDKVGGME